MADRRISTGTLTSIADAIRRKTGGSALITPQDMASEIDSISTGGTAKTLTKLSELTVDTATQNVTTNITEQMASCEVLYLKLDNISMSASDWLYISVNTMTNKSSDYLGYVGKVTTISQTLCLVVLNPSGDLNLTGRICTIIPTAAASRSKTVSALETIIFSPYTSSVNITSGKIEVWGYV